MNYMTMRQNTKLNKNSLSDLNKNRKTERVTGFYDFQNTLTWN